MKKHSKSCRRSEASSKRAKSRGPVQRDAKEVMAEVLGKLTGKLNAPAVSTSAQENRRGRTMNPPRLSFVTNTPVNSSASTTKNVPPADGDGN